MEDAVVKVKEGVLAPREITRLLSFLSRFPALSGINAGEQSDPSAPCKWYLHTANLFEKQFLQAAQQGIKRSLGILGLDFGAKQEQENDDVWFIYCFQQFCTDPLSIQDLQNLVAALEEQINRRGLFDYSLLMNSVLGALKQLMRERVTPFTTSLLGLSQEDSQKFLEGLQQVQATPTVPSGFDDTLEDETGYATAQVFHAPNVFHPNPNAFTEKHVAVGMAPLGPHVKRVYALYELQTIYTPPHEIVHCLQTLLWNHTTNGWRKEWEASVPSLGILYSLAQSYPFLFPDGLAEEAILAIYDATVWCHQKVSQQVQEGYILFRESLGTKSPILIFDEAKGVTKERGGEESGIDDLDAAITQDPIGSWYCKARAAVEGFEHHKKEEKGWLHSVLCFLRKLERMKEEENEHDGEGEGKMQKEGEKEKECALEKEKQELGIVYRDLTHYMKGDGTAVGGDHPLDLAALSS